MKKLLLSLCAAIVAVAAQAQLVPVSTDPADGSSAEFIRIIEAVFDEDISVNSDNMILTKGSEDGEEIKATWGKYASGKTVRFFMWDEYYEGYESVTLEPGVDYFLTIPQGLVTGKTSGLTNDKIVIKVTGKEAGLKLTSITPYDGSTAEQIRIVEAVFEEDVEAVTENLKVTKGSPEGDPLGARWDKYRSGKTVRFFMWDEYYEGYDKIALEPGETYYITIPAGAVKGTSGKVNDEIVVKVTGAALELKPVSTTPADGDVMKTFYNITLNFNTRVSMVAGIMPTFTKDSPTGTDLADQWNGSAGTNSVTYWIEDLDGYVDPKTLDAGATYYITIPAGAIKNDAGTTTDEIVITIKGEHPFLTVVSTTPASGTEATEFTDLEVNFGETVTVDRDLSAAIHKGSKDGEVVNAYWGVRAITDGIIVYTLDEYYEGPEAVPFEPGNKYYVVIPAGIAKNAAGAINDEIVVEFVCPAAPLEFVSSTPADGEVVVEAFSTITLTFSDDVQVVTKDCGATLKDAEGNNYGAEFWFAFPGDDSKSINVIAQDMDYFVTTVTLEKNQTYTFTVPAGIISNAAGGTNSEIVITLKGEQDTTTISTLVGNKEVKSQKVLRNGELQIIIGNDIYNANGAKVK